MLPDLKTPRTTDEIGANGEKIAFFHSIPIHGYGKQLKNIYLPLKNGETTEIDIVVIHTNGIFVLESKNYNGWIFGKDTDKNWTAIYRNQKKYTFYNPIRQNQTHVNEISRITGIDKKQIFSFIVFGRETELKKITNNTPILL